MTSASPPSNKRYSTRLPGCTTPVEGISATCIKSRGPNPNTAVVASGSPRTAPAIVNCRSPTVMVSPVVTSSNAYSLGASQISPGKGIAPSLSTVPYGSTDHCKLPLSGYPADTAFTETKVILSMSATAIEGKPRDTDACNPSLSASLVQASGNSVRLTITASAAKKRALSERSATCNRETKPLMPTTTQTANTSAINRMLSSPLRQSRNKNFQVNVRVMSLSAEGA